MTILDTIGTLTGLYEETIDLKEPFLDLAARFVQEPGTVCLMSGGDRDCSRYHVLAARPMLIFSGKGKSMTLSSGTKEQTFEADPFDTLRLVLNHFKNEEVSFPDPVAAGLFGYLAYDLKDEIERLPRTSLDDLDLPSIYMTLPSLLIVHDKHEETTRLYVPLFSENGQKEKDFALMYFNTKMDGSVPKDYRYSGDKTFKSNFDQPSYMVCIDKIRDYISAGDIYQVNMSQRFQTGFNGNPFGLFRTLYQRNPAPFFAYIHAGNHQIVSTSPERFIKREKENVETRPIKGTRPRGKTPEEDAQNQKELSESRKDDAELSMIVDLMRNDIGKVCKGGSVKVREHKRVEAYENVFHLISIVDGILDDSSDAVDLIKATFPGGSITGCPKIRSMEIIDELETHRRHVYTGSIGYIGFHGTLDLSIAIRTATVSNHKLVFSVGGGVVFDSDPADEYHETLHKGKTLLEALSGDKSSHHQPYAWVNGGLLPLLEASVPVTDLGFQYGHGFFETIRAEQGRICYLDDHVQRLHKAWTTFFPQPFPDLSWDLVIAQVLGACRLDETVAAVKIIVTRGSRTASPWDNRIVITARPYTHRLDMLHKTGLDLITWDSPRQSPLADYKSLNYQYYYLAGDVAKAKGADEAVILNADGSVSECNTSNILFVKDKTAIRPSSPHVLDGVMERRVIDLLAFWGYTIESRPVFSKDCGDFHQAIVTNSLMGAVPVLTLDKQPFKDATALCTALNKELLLLPPGHGF